LKTLFIFDIIYKTNFFIAWIWIIHILKFFAAWEIQTFLWYWIFIAFYVWFFFFLIFWKNLRPQFHFLVISILFFLCFLIINFFLNMIVFFETGIRTWTKITLILYTYHGDNVWIRLLIRVELIWNIQIFRMLYWGLWDTVATARVRFFLFFTSYWWWVTNRFWFVISDRIK
jgi:hypothetical protein